MKKIRTHKMNPNMIYKAKVSISGFIEAQVEDGLPHLLDEFRQRPWLLETQAYWDESTNKLVIIVGYDLDIRLEEGAIDEVGDCVIATMQFDKEIKFDVERI